MEYWYHSAPELSTTLPELSWIFSKPTLPSEPSAKTENALAHFSAKALVLHPKNLCGWVAVFWGTNEDAATFLMSITFTIALEAGETASSEEL
ncbi:hypothetical protein D7Y13_26825 [Corallococcus praedator]|uniref:Uncharacterized protein n=1 Tax=Corallococcus praedator TaxID=2316724 RepID=A0ABX9QCS7_9BACT|nr:hypothetical protein D7X75_32750 [Corallococcus sp. CA031C]RKI00595.1 hypothetical protein D7Y13_26825 [Corallococcus praedator]